MDLYSFSSKYREIKKYVNKLKADNSKNQCKHIVVRIADLDSILKNDLFISSHRIETRNNKFTKYGQNSCHINKKKFYGRITPDKLNARNLPTLNNSQLCSSECSSSKVQEIMKTMIIAIRLF